MRISAAIQAANNIYLLLPIKPGSAGWLSDIQEFSCGIQQADRNDEFLPLWRYIFLLLQSFISNTEIVVPVDSDFLIYMS